MPYEHRLGNSYADYWADVATKTVACDQGHRRTVSMNDASGWLIRNRLLCICQNFLPQYKRELRVPVRHRINRTRLLEEKGHQVTLSNRRLICNLCTSTWPTNGQSSVYSSAGMCSGIPPIGQDLFLGHTNCPKRILAAGLHIRGAKVHASHRLAYLRGILFCTKCGCYTIKIVRGLKAECRLKPSCVQQERGLNCMLQGEPPHGLPWPTEETEVPRFISPYLVYLDPHTNSQEGYGTYGQIPPGHTPGEYCTLHGSPPHHSLIHL